MSWIIINAIELPTCTFTFTGTVLRVITSVVVWVVRWLLTWRTHLLFNVQWLWTTQAWKLGTHKKMDISRWRIWSSWTAYCRIPSGVDARLSISNQRKVVVSLQLLQYTGHIRHHHILTIPSKHRLVLQASVYLHRRGRPQYDNPATWLAQTSSPSQCPLPTFTTQTVSSSCH
jgi:hypothetical protein